MTLRKTFFAGTNCRPTLELESRASKWEMQSAHKSKGELLQQKAQLLRESNRVLQEFLIIDLELSLTFAKTAQQSGCDEERKIRNQRNARRGYESVMSFLKNDRVEFEPGVRDQFRERLKELRHRLRCLGELMPEQND